MSTTPETAIPLAEATCPLCKVTYCYEYGVRRHDVRSHLGNMHPNIRYERNFEAAMDKMLATAKPVEVAVDKAAVPAVVVTADDLAEMLEDARSIERGLRADLDGMVRIEAELRARVDSLQADLNASTRLSGQRLERLDRVSVALGRIAGQPCLPARESNLPCRDDAQNVCDTCNARRALKGGA